MNKISIPGLKTKIGLTIAALILLLEFGAFYLYRHASSEKLFGDNYHPYQPHIMRGSSNRSSLKDSYMNGKMDSVIWQFKSLDSPVPEEYLLTGIAYLEKNQPAKAIETFQIMIQKNTNSNTDFFEEDAEYYLAMGYLSNNESEKAMPIFEKIQADTEHPYYNSVTEWFVLNVKTLIAKK